MTLWTVFVTLGLAKILWESFLILNSLQYIVNSLQQIVTYNKLHVYNRAQFDRFMFTGLSMEKKLSPNVENT